MSLNYLIIKPMNIINYYFKSILSFCILTTLCMTEAKAQFSGGDGTANNPYQISTLNDLILLSESPEYWDYITYFIQIADIDASNTDTLNGGLGFKPIGIGYGANEQSFSGYYNGNGYSIINLYINRPNQNYVGLFGATSRSTEFYDSIIIVKNLKLIDAYVFGNNNVGGFVGGNMGRIINCFISGNIIGNNVVGGIADFSRGVVDCRSEAKVVGNNDVGGLVGVISTCLIGHSILNSSASGDITGKNNVGGLAGGNMLALGIENPVYSSFATGNVTGEENVGGLVGDNRADLFRCYSTSRVVGKSNVGGLIGKNLREFKECYTTGDVSGVNNVGGLVGNNNQRIYNCYSMGNIDGNINTGGIVGYTETSIITTCYSISEVSGDSNVGGFVGFAFIGMNHYSGFYNNVNTDTSAATGLALPEMQKDTSFKGFDFSSIWAIHPLINCGYPYLQAIPPGATDTIFSITDNSRCGKGTLVLEATAQSGKINWYNLASRGDILYTGESFETPFLDSSASFWVELKDEYCVLPRREVFATLFLIDLSVSQTVDTLFAKEDSAIYQWLDCGNNFKPISGATLQTFTPDTTGNYAVEITKNSCTDTSSCILMYIGNVEIADKRHQFSIYPNPAINQLTIEVFDNNIYSFEIKGLTGNLIANGNLQNGENLIDISTISAGVYFVHLLIDGNLITTFKVIKQTE